jgi:uncharacterized protein YlxW (UPF0749 family)
LLGLLLSVSFYTKNRVEVTAPRASELVDVVNSMQKERDSLKKSLVILRKQISNYEKEIAAKSGSLGAFTKEEKSLKEAAGLLPVEGEGLTIILADATSIPNDANSNDYVVHNTDLQAIVNAVWAGGAKAVSINGQRLVGTSAIRCAGNTILVNSNLAGSPYEVKVLGNPEKIKKSLAKDQSVRVLVDQLVKNFGIKYELREEEVSIPSYRGSLGVEHSKLMKGDNR